MALTQTIPALPVREVAPAVTAYVDRLGFIAEFVDEGLAVLRRDQAVIHLWLAGDSSWAQRSDLPVQPVRSGAESFLAGTASCRIQVSEAAQLEALFAEYAAAGVLHPVSRSGISNTDFGADEFHVLDADGNLLSFFV